MEIYWLEQTATNVPDGNLWLSARESGILTGMRFPRRRADWRLGRWTAKQAVAARLQLPFDLEALAHIEIRAASSGAPELFTGGRRGPFSIALSHRNGIAFCAIGTLEHQFGCDLEYVEPRSDAFIADYFTNTERRLIENTNAQCRQELVTLMWSAKESALKALREGLRLDTRSVSVNPCEELERSDLKPDRWRPMTVTHAATRDFTGWWRVEGSMVRTIVSIQPLEIPLRIERIPVEVDRYAVCTSGTSVFVTPRP